MKFSVLLSLLLMVCMIDANIMKRPPWRESEEVDLNDNRNDKSFLEAYGDDAGYVPFVAYEDNDNDVGRLNNIVEENEYFEGENIPCRKGMKRDQAGICRTVW